jgi:hypothetical protein
LSFSRSEWRPRKKSFLGNGIKVARGDGGTAIPISYWPLGHWQSTYIDGLGSWDLFVLCLRIPPLKSGIRLRQVIRICWVQSGRTIEDIFCRQHLGRLSSPGPKSIFDGGPATYYYHRGILCSTDLYIRLFSGKWLTHVFVQTLKSTQCMAWLSCQWGLRNARSGAKATHHFAECFLALLHRLFPLRSSLEPVRVAYSVRARCPLGRAFRRIRALL